MESSPNVWIYLRKSRALGDPDDPNLLAAHLEALSRKAREDEAHIPPERIVREVRSGETIADRPLFHAWLQGIESLPRGASGAVYVTEIARLSRGSPADEERIRRAFVRAGILIRTPSRVYDLRNPDDEQIWDIETFVARQELRLFKRRQALKRAELRRKGRSPNMIPPYPYEVDRSRPRDPRWVPDPVRFALAQGWCRDIFSHSLRALAERDGVTVSIVHEVLRNPAICGYPCRRWEYHDGARPWKTQDCQPLPRDRWEWPERAGDYPAVCTREEWEAIQRHLASRRFSRAQVGSLENGWCRQVVRFVGRGDQVASLSCYRYACTPERSYFTYEINRQGPGPRIYVPRDLIHGVAEAALRAAFASPAFRVRLAQRAQDAALWQPPPTSDTEALESRLVAARRRLEQIVSRELDADTEELRALTTLRARAKQEIAAAESALRQAAEVAHDPREGELLASLSVVASEWEEFWAEADGTLKAAAVTALIARIWVRVEKEPGRLMHRREVERIEWRPGFGLEE